MDTGQNAPSKKIDIWYEAIQVEPAVYKREKEIHALHLKRMQTDWVPDNNSKLSAVFEPWEGQPIRFFFFEINGKKYCGQKLLSPIVTEHQSPGFFCSLIKVEMLLGTLIRSQISQKGVEVFYKELTIEERRNIFDELKNDRMVDIYYPFVHLTKSSRLEIDTPDEGWFITEERAELLSIGERYLRRVSVELVKSDQLENPIIYDPACSTGKFLAEIKSAIPNAIVIGQDLSQQMCAWAAPKLDKIIVGNSIKPGVSNYSCDYIFFRFLNAEVVSTEMAKQLFVRIILCLKDNGKAILFGHTPVLISVPFMQMMGYSLICCNEYIHEENAVFQYYIIQRDKNFSAHQSGESVNSAISAAG